jgi:photosystem II stability/assembly factor-like uncharacterized protein
VKNSLSPFRVLRRSPAVVLLMGISATGAAASAPAAAPRLAGGTTASAPFVIGSVDFVSPNHGWVTVGNTATHWGRLYGTVDGGRSWWRALTFRTGGLFSNRYGTLGTELDFLTPRVGFLIAAYGTAGHSHWVLHRTSNGGRTWTAVGLPHKPWEYVTSFSFLNARKGWLLASGVITTGHYAGEVFTTDDAGATWKRLAWTGYTRNNVPVDRGYLGGSMDSIRFTSLRSGWIFGESPIVGPAANEHTADGGRTWNACGFPPARPRKRLPACGPIAPPWLTKTSIKTGQGQVFVTQLDGGDFFGRGGLLPEDIIVPRQSHGLVVPPKYGGYYMYRLNRGRDSWVDPRLLPLHMPLAGSGSGVSLFQPPVVDIESLHQWFFANRDKLVYTLNGGRTWRTSRTGLSGGLQPAGIRFFDRRSGLIWATIPPDGGAFSTRSVLERTDDAGRTWKVLHLPLS